MAVDESRTNEMPSAVLKAEHQVILRVIGVLERLAERAEQDQGFEADALEQCVAFFRFFADACHHAKEEDLLFPEMEKAGIPREGGPIGCMLEEHRIAREHTKTMGEGLEALGRGEPGAQQIVLTAARDYASLLRNHIFKEDNVLFNMGDQMLSGDVQSSLCAEFCQVACRKFGDRTREELKRMADELEQRWPTPGDRN